MTDSRPGRQLDTWQQVRRPVFVVLAIGVVARLILDFATGSNGDIDHGGQIAAILIHHPLSAYSDQRVAVYPYPPGYFGVLALTKWFSDGTGIAFHTLERLPIIAADIATAWVVARWLAGRGESVRRCVLGTSLIALNPLSAVISGIHGQLDPVPTFLAVAALSAWTRMPAGRRAYVAGTLLGVAAAVKPAPAVIIVALLVVCQSVREAAKLVLPFVVILGGVLAPWLIASWTATTTWLRYQGLPGIGGLSLVAQPRLATLWLAGATPHPNAALHHLERHADAVTLIALAIATAVVALRRPKPEVGALLMLLPLYVLGVNLSVHYTVWVLPLLVMAVPRAAAVVAAVMLIPGTFVYLPLIRGELASRASPWSTGVVETVYVPVVFALMAAAAIGFVVVASRSRWHDIA